MSRANIVAGMATISHDSLSVEVLVALLGAVAVAILLLFGMYVSVAGTVVTLCDIREGDECAMSGWEAGGLR